jgi:taurine transport system permease protein
MSDLETRLAQGTVARGGADDGPRRPAAGRFRVSGAAIFPAVVTIGSLAFALAAWAVVASLVEDPNLLPTPGTVFSRFIDLLSTGPGGVTLTKNVAVSLGRILLGWGLGVVGGVVLGTLMALNRWVRAVLDPLIEIARPVPPLAFIPLLIIWFGIGETPKVIILVFGTLPVVLIATASAIRGVDENWLRAAQTLGASRWQQIWRVTIPAALPEILVAVRIAQGLAWGSLIAAEIIASTAGLGWMILQAGRFLETPTIFVGILTIGFLAYFTDRLLRVVEYLLVPWKGQGNK